jgi:hypothetical protein
MYCCPTPLRPDVWRSEDEGVSWVLVTAAAPFAPRCLHVLVFYRGTILLFGGQLASGSSGDVWASFDSGRAWTLQPTMTMPAGRHGMAVGRMGDDLLVAGGYTGGVVTNSVQVWPVSPATDGFCPAVPRRANRSYCVAARRCWRRCCYYREGLLSIYFLSIPPDP